MADLTLRIAGQDDASGALHEAAASMDVLTEQLSKNKDGAEENAKAIVKWQEAMNLAKKGVSEIIAITKESIKLVQEEEAARRRLSFVAGENTEALVEQAAALEGTLGVQGETVMQMQALLLQFGAAPTQIDATTRAILDFSAETGQDALAATRALLGGIETGKNSFKEYGFQITTTGEATADLASATDVLAKKFGGAAANEADSLAGQVARAESAMENLKKSWGALITDFINDTGVVNKLSEAMQGLQKWVFGDKDAERKAAAAAEGVALAERIDAQKKFVEELIANSEIETDIVEMEIDQLNTLIAKARQLQAVAQGSDKPGLSSEVKKRITAKGRKDAAGEAKGGGYDPYFIDLELLDKSLGELPYQLGDTYGPEHKPDELAKQKAKDDQAEAERQKELTRRAEHARQLADAEIKALKAKEQEAMQAGLAFGNALASGITSALENLMTGKEDPDASLKNILASVVAGAGTLLGAILSPYTGGASVVAGAALGSLGAAAIRSTIGKHHDGGWIGAPRFHSGGWSLGADEIPAILQTGERVLSRTEVAAAGGPGAVDSMAQGGGSRTTVIQALDAGSFTEYLSAKGGRAMFNARRIGRTVMDG